MSKSESPLEISPEALHAAVHRELFKDERLLVYAVLDGAAIPGLLDHLYAVPGPEFVCLYRGELNPDLAECAPYLVQLQPDTAFTDWLLAEGWGKHWGVFATASESLKTMRKHFRTFLMVKDPAGQQLYFRYYDPRVLRIYLPTCNAQELGLVCGPVQAYLLEDETPTNLLRFTRDGRRAAARINQAVGSPVKVGQYGYADHPSKPAILLSQPARESSHDVAIVSRDRRQLHPILFRIESSSKPRSNEFHVDCPPGQL